MKLKPSRILSTGLFAVFAYAGALKALKPSLFYDHINQYHLISEPAAWYVAHYLPWLEIIAGLACLFRKSRTAACLIIACLLVIFMAVLFFAWLRNFHFSCGCFGSIVDSVNFSWDIGMDSVLFLSTIYVLHRASRSEISTPPTPEPNNLC